MCFIDRNGYETRYDVMLLNSICFTTVILPLHRFIRLYLSDLNETDSLSRNGNQRRSNRIRSIAIAHEPPGVIPERKEFPDTQWQPVHSPSQQTNIVPCGNDYWQDCQTDKLIDDDTIVATKNVHCSKVIIIYFETSDFQLSETYFFLRIGAVSSENEPSGFLKKVVLSVVRTFKKPQENPTKFANTLSTPSWREGRRRPTRRR